MSALSEVHDPELSMSVAELGLIREIRLDPEGFDGVEVRVVLTSVFCPWGPALLEEIRSKTEEATGMPTKVTLLAERWDPRDAGLAW